uniref:Uncharacterized protein n=1 Tax=Pseudomonas aeruginosa TaxID=287 RepID=A0A2L1KH96_PSEAI|nr:Hypothetical protein [Pseudomonas aeruginosa]QFX78719.1 hypothetical protein pNK546KPC_0509 [Pseudomonas aeruginosa]UGK55856.1 Hypothetical protein [Pseudomonas aeruginosa]
MQLFQLSLHQLQWPSADCPLVVRGDFMGQEKDRQPKKGG